MSSTISKRGLRAFIFSLAVCFNLSFGMAQADILTIGTISADPVDEIRNFKPFADYLVRQLASDGVDKVKVQVARDIPEIAGMLKRQKIDLFIDSSVTALIVNNLSGSKFLLRRWKKGRGKYRSVIFVNSDSGISRLRDLRNKIIAFEEPFSTSGFILPALEVLRSGLELSQLDDVRSRLASGKVNYVLANDNETQMVWLERDRVAAAAMAEDDFNEYSKNALKPLTILFTTPYVPYHVVTYRSGLEAKYVRRIKEVLKSAHETEEGRVVLEKFEQTARFDEIPDELLSEIHKLVPFLNKLNLAQ